MRQTQRQSQPAHPRADARPGTRIARHGLALVTALGLGLVSALSATPALAFVDPGGPPSPVAGATPVDAGRGVRAVGTLAAAPLPDSSAVTWGTNGGVRKVLSVGGRVVVAGEFSAVVSPSGRTVPASNLGVLDPVTGTFDLTFAATTNGAVNTMASDGATLYLGGDFTAVNGQPRTRLAAVSMATGALAPWAPRADGSVTSLGLAGGSVVVGGVFASVVGTTTSTASGPYLARVTPQGEVSTVRVPLPDGPVRAFVAGADPSVLYVGGDFAVMDGNTTAARRTAKINADTGVLDPNFRSGLTNGPYRATVGAMAFGSGQLYLAVGGSGGACAGQDPLTGETRWSKKANGDMQGVEHIGGITYCGGHFGGTASFDGLDRQKVAAVDPVTATTLSWAPRVNSALGVFAMDTDGTSLFVGGDFTTFGTPGVGHLASLLAPQAQTLAGPVVALQGFAYDSGVELAWDRPSTDGGSPVTWYDVTRREGTTTTVVGKRVKQESFTDATALNGHSYTYGVAAVTARGTSPSVVTPTLTPAALGALPPSSPQEPLALAGELSVTLSWRAPVTTGGAPVLDYVVWRSVDGAEPTVLTTLSPSARGYRDVAVTTASSYRYEITARNAAGPSTAASTQTVRPAPSKPPAPRLSVSVGPGTAATLTWVLAPNTSGSPITKYLVIRDAVRYVNVTATSETGGSLVDTGVQPGRTYKYQVRALSAAGTSPGSNVVTVTIP